VAEIKKADDKTICKEWDDIYQNIYMANIAQTGLKYDSQVNAASEAYQGACKTIMQKYGIDFYRLDAIIQKNSRVFNKPK